MLLMGRMCLLEMPLSEIDVKKVYEIVFKKYGNTSRIDHIMGVYKMANYLATKNNISTIKASIAALVHDYYRYESISVMKEYLDDDSDIIECEQYPFLYHAYCSAKSLKDVFNIDDIEIYNAIRYHVVGKKDMSLLDKIIFISDYTEETRQYDDCIRVRKILLDKGLDEAIYYATLYTTRHHKDSIHETQKYILDTYKEKIL